MSQKMFEPGKQSPEAKLVQEAMKEALEVLQSVGTPFDSRNFTATWQAILDLKLAAADDDSDE